MSLPNDELTVRSLLFDNAKAVCAKDLDKIMAQYAPDVRAFDAVAQLQFRGIKEYRKHWEKCLNFCPGPTIFEIDHLEVEVEHNLALCHCLIHCGEVNEAGESATSWMRATICFKKIKGEWKIIHEHYSLPFDMVSGETMFQLKP